MHTAGVYEFWCGTYFYQGSSSRLEERLREHRRALSRGSHRNPKVQSAFNKHGMHDERVLVVCEPHQILSYEQDYIDANWGDPLYLNLDPLASSGGNFTGRKHSEETKAKLSAAGRAQRGRPGKKHSDESRAKMSAALIGRKLSEEHVANSRASRLGMKQSEEHVAKVRAARLGTSHSEETKAKIGAKSKGRKHSEETKAKISATKINKPRLHDSDLGEP
jgi:group I intron endonuclease